MPRLIVKWRYHDAGDKHTANYVQYIGTREGVQKSEQENYMGYIACRPNSHGLFSYTGERCDLRDAVRQVGSHPGKVWTAILSLRREDAEQIGYDNAASWQSFLSANACEIAEKMHIEPSNFRWYAAFHDEADHPHVHLVAYAGKPGNEYLTKNGIQQIKSLLARQLFQSELKVIYENQTQARKELNEIAQARFRQSLQDLRTTTTIDPELLRLLVQLQQRLEQTKGKKVYGYLPKATKQLVDSIVDQIAKEPAVKNAYDAWYALRMQVIRTYQDTEAPQPPLSEQTEFRTIRNMVIREVLAIPKESAHQTTHNEQPVRVVSRMSEQTGFRTIPNTAIREELAPPNESAQQAAHDERIVWAASRMSEQPEFCTIRNTGTGEVHAPPKGPTQQAAHDEPTVRAACRILKQLEKLFADNIPLQEQTMHGRIDRKRLRELRRKRRALGHAAGDLDIKL